MGNKLGGLIPGFYGDTEEFQALWETEEKAFQEACGALNDVYLDTTVLQCSEEVLARWEHALELESVGSLAQRKMVIVAKMRGLGPLSEERICNMLSSFTGGEAAAIVSFSPGVILVQVLPPENGEIYDFGEIEKALAPRIPAHLRLTVERYYSTWGDLASAASDWFEIYVGFLDWDGVKNYVER